MQDHNPSPASDVSPLDDADDPKINWSWCVEEMREGIVESAERAAWEQDS